MSTHKKTENTSHVANEIHINCLNDDCFMEIFKYLTTLEKMEASFVCTRWAGILVKKLDINDELIEEITQKSKILPLYIVDYIKTCGNYLNYLKIDLHLIQDYTASIIKEIKNNCKSIIHLEFFDYDSVNDLTLNEDDIELIFKNNVNLGTLKLSNLKLDGKSLLKLQPHALEEFIVCYCRFDSLSYLFDFLSKLNNVKILEIRLFDYDDEEEDLLCDLDKETIDLQKKLESKAINALNQSNCKDIIEFEWITVTGFDETNELSDLLSKQKKLRKLKLKKIKVHETFFECLSKDNLEVLEIDLIENQKNFSFPQFKNLQVIKWSNLVISDETVQFLTMCKNLKDLKLFKVSDYLLTEDGESAFGQLQNLESLGIRIRQKNIDNVLLALTQCKDLKIIDITSCHFTDTGLKSLLKVPKLTNLNVSETNITNDQLKKLVKESSLLQLEVFECQNLSTKILDEIRWAINLGTYNLNLEYDSDWYEDYYFTSSDSSSFDDDDSDEDNSDDDDSDEDNSDDDYSDEDNSDDDYSDEDNSDDDDSDALEGINRLFEGFNVHD